MNARDRLDQARRWALEGRHEEALDEFVWFHRHALEEDAALRGVRLSFALDWWLQLGEAYPVARTAYDATRQAKVDRMMSGAFDRRLFNDVHAMNVAAGDELSTYHLFLRLRELSPGFAADCADIALPAIAHAGDTALARDYLPDPEPAVEWKASQLNDDVARAREEPEDRRRILLDAFATLFAEDVRLLRDVLRHAGDQAGAEALRQRALALVADDDIRDAIRAKLDA
jgi:hypothetical protein